MIESSSPPKEFRSHNADFRLRYAWPKAYAKDERHDMQYTYALLADEAEITILTKHKLFQ